MNNILHTIWFEDDFLITKYYYVVEIKNNIIKLEKYFCINGVNKLRKNPQNVETTYDALIKCFNKLEMSKQDLFKKFDYKNETVS